MLLFQQGDVLLKKLTQEVKGGKKLDHLTLAEGEATGHYHRITSGVAQLILLGDRRILKVLSDYARLTHEEHKEILVPKGDYEVFIVQEYDHFLEESRQVRD